MTLNRPVFFLATDHVVRSRSFYEETLGLEFVADEPAALVFRNGDRPLRIQKVDRFDPALQTVLGWEVDDLQVAIGDLRKRGVDFERFEFLEQDEAGVWISPAGARVAWFKDPCGNLLSLTERPDV